MRRINWASARLIRQGLIRGLSGSPRLSEPAAQVVSERYPVDELTGLTHRTHFFEFLESYDRDLWIFLIDIDGFSAVNRRHGHRVGDQVLAAIARRLTDLDELTEAAISRFGADEFVAALDQSGVADPSTIGALLRDTIERPIAIGQKSIEVSATVGIAAKLDDQKAGTALNHADSAVRRGKTVDRGAVVTFTTEIDDISIIQTKVEAELPSALRNGDIHPWAQPIFDLNTGQVVGVELLARWFDADHRAIPPEVFVPIASASGSLPLLTAQMIDTAADLLTWWKGRPGFRHILVGVNIAPAGLGDGWLIGEINERFSRTGAPTTRLVLEITEGEGIDDMTMAAAELGNVADMGTTIALDDFGSGYSSLGQLVQLPVHWAKLDITLIERLGRDDRCGALVAAIASAASDVGVGVLAEGVETTEQLVALRSIGIRFGQGFGLAMPMPLDELDAFIERGVSWTTTDLAPAG